MASIKSNYYALDRLLSSNALCQSWIATDKLLNRKVFVKISNPDGELDSEEIKSILSTSCGLQKHIKCRNILTANKIRREHSHIFIEFPYLEPSQWSPLDLNLYSSDFSSMTKVMASMAVIVDFIHTMGYVHGDLKLGNFLVRQGRNGPELKLIDLEFLQNSDQPPRHKIFGTPGHIAPEIIKNDIILARSDVYSLGMSLRIQLENLTVDRRSGIPDELRAFIEDLTRESYFRRPWYVLDSLHNHGLIDDEIYRKGLIQVLELKLKNRYKEWGQKIAENKISLNDFIIRENNVFGICYDYLDDISSLGKRFRIRAIGNFRHLLKKSIITRYGEFWQINICDDLYRKLYADLSRFTGTDKDILAVDDNPHDENIEDVIIRLEEYSSRRHNLKARLLIEDIFSRLDLEKPCITIENLVKVYRWLINILDINGSFTKAVSYSQKVLNMPRLPSELLPEILHNIVRLSIKGLDLTTAANYVDRGIEESQKQGNIEYEFKFDRNRAFINARMGNADKALADLERIAGRARAIESSVERARTHLAIETILYSIGRFKVAREECLKALDLCKSNGDEASLFLALTHLTSINLELGNYKQSKKYCLEAAMYCDRSGDALKIASVYSSLTALYIRCASFKEAEFALNRYIYSYGSGGEGAALRTYYSYMGYLLMNRGSYDKALQKFWDVLGLYKGNEYDSFKGNAFQSIAQISLFKGETQTCREFCRKAREVFSKYPEKTTLLELDLIEILNENPPNLCRRLLSLFKELIARGASYYAALSLFNVLIYEDTLDLTDDIDTHEWLNLIRSQSEVPIFNALGILINDIQDQSRNGIKTIAAFKAVYRVLHKSGQFYWAFLVCLRISEKYGETRDFKLAARFLQQAVAIAHDIGNIRREKDIKDELARTSNLDRGDEKLLQSMHRISEILQSMDDVEEALNNLVRLSVDLTGAERGVLLLWDYNAHKYQVRAQIDCDEDSLVDIRDFSNKVTRSVLEGAEPVIIRDALKDERTKTHKSIIANNIQSVLCVPIPGHDRINGVLYLDHHTIPSLFEPEDLTYIKSIANFVSTAITRIWDLKSARAEKSQLQEELKRLGGRHSFITQDPTVMNLLNELTPMAKSNIGILLTGESGTGKEILSRMIHELSPRAKMPFRTMHCPGIPTELAESILFGIDDRVATNVSGRDGIFTSADGGTLFMDEIADLPPALQAKILRAIEYQEFERVGSNRVMYADIRFIFATNKDLEQLIKDGQFRSDLYYRISKIIFKIPPLRHRRSDIPVLVEYFIENSGISPQNRPRIHAETMEKMMQYNWPGNVRELKNIVEMFCVRYQGREIDLSLLPPDIASGQPAGAYEPRYLAENREKEKIRSLLMENDWNQAIVAKIMNISPATLHRRIKKYNIKRPR